MNNSGPIETRPGWIKTSKSGAVGNCVEVAQDLSGLSDTKDASHQAIYVGPAAVRALLAHAQTLQPSA